MQSKFTSPLLGYNNNVRHKARVFHIQTEDSGVKHPHIITHLFMDGGRILKSIKKSYAEHVGVDGMTDIVKTMMKEQHKAMFIALRDGQFDHLVDPALAPKDAAAGAPSSTQLAAQAATTAKDLSAHVPPSAASVPGPASATASAGTPASASAGAGAAAPASAGGVASGRAAAVATAPAASDARPEADDEPVPSDGATQIAVAPAPSLTLDIDALERAAKDAEGGSPLFQSSSDLPPPPENLFRDRPAASGYRGGPGTEERPRSRPPAAAPTSGRPNVPPPRPAASAPARARAASDTPRRAPQVAVAGPADARYAPTRPASIFGAPRPPSASSTSIFGGDLMSDKSLDEVILSYLAEDLELEGKKK